MSNVETPVSHDVAARELITQLQAIRQSIGGFVFLSPSSIKRMVPAASIPDPFIMAVGNSVNRSELLRGASLLPGGSYAELVAFSTAYGAVLAEADQLMRGIRDMILARRYEVAQEALRVYGIAQRFNRPADREQLVPHITAMREALGRTRSKPTDQPDETPPDGTGNGNGNGNGQGGKK